jgi:hypothetical protein
MLSKPIKTNELHPTIDANYYKGQSNQRRLIAVRENNTVGGEVLRHTAYLGHLYDKR